MIGVPTEGIIRIEWAAHRYGQIIPINWQMGDFTISYSPDHSPSVEAVGFSIDDAYNVIIKHAINQRVEWLLTIEDDVLVPHDLFLKIAQYMEEKKYPIVSGLYYSKGNPSEPLIFRGRGNGVFKDWEMGDKVFCDGIPFGCMLVHMSILKHLYEVSPEYTAPNGDKVKKVIETPRKKYIDPETKAYMTQVGTQDLYFCDRLIKDNIFEKTGWDLIANQKYPFLCDTSIYCGHIDRQTGVVYPDASLNNLKKHTNLMDANSFIGASKRI